VKIINIQTLSVIDIVMFASFSLVFFIQLYYILKYYLRLARHRDGEPAQGSSPISVILTVRNEEDRIRDILDKFTGQQFDDYQLFVINEYSEDSTFEILTVLAETNPKLKVTSLSQETQFSRKQAINIGMKGSSSPWIILLTANTDTINPEWLFQLNSMLSPETDVVIAYTNIEKSHGFRNLICRLEYFNQFMISGAWILAGKSFVFNENNILFKKSMYFDTLGFRHKLNRNFANLELIFNENFKKGKVAITTNPKTTIREHIEDDRGDHIKLLKKTVQIRQSLSWKKKISLFLDDFTRLLLLSLAVALILIHPEYWITICTLPVICIILFAIIVKILLNRLMERNIFVTSLLYFLIKPIINWWLIWSMYLIHRRSKWN